MIDADERATKPLEREIKEVISLNSENVGYYVKRDNYMFGARTRFGANFGDLQLRLIRKEKAEFQGLVHERMKPEGPCGVLKNHMVHMTHQTLDEYFKKFDLYTSLDAKESLKRAYKPNWLFDVGIKPLLGFTYFYFFKLGFLDGLQGLLSQALSFYYSCVKNIKAIQYVKKGT